MGCIYFKYSRGGHAFCFEMQPKALSAYDLAHDKLCILLVSAMRTGLFILYGIFKRDAWKSGDQQ